MKARTLLLAAALATWPVFSAVSASPWAEVGDNQLRSDVELLQAAGVIDTITTHWPLPWGSLTAALAQAPLAGQPASVRAAAARVIARAEAATGHGWYASAYADGTNQPSVVYGFDGMGRGKGEAQLSLEGIGDGIAGRVSLGAFSQDFHGRSVKLMPEGTYFSADVAGARIYGGYLDHWWGPGQVSALSLSNNGRPMPQVGIERSSTQASSLPVLNWLGPWQVEFLLGYMDGPRLQRDTYYNALRFTFHPLPGLEIGAARTEMFCGQGHPCAPLRDYFDFTNDPAHSNNTNDQGEFDIKYSGLLGTTPFQVYMQVMNEDSSPIVQSDSSHLFGASIFVPTRGNAVKLTAEFTDSIATHDIFSFGDDHYGSSYNNNSYLGGMRYRGRTLGFSLDSDSTLLSLQGSWTGPGGRFYELSFHHADIGNSRAPAGSNIVSATPVRVNMGEARVSLPWNGVRFDLAGRLQDDQPQPHSGFAAAIELAMRADL